MRPFWGWISVVLGLLFCTVVVDGERCSNGPSASSLLFDTRRKGGMKHQKYNEYGGGFGDCTSNSEDDLEKEEEENEWPYNHDGFALEETEEEDDWGDNDKAEENDGRVGDASFFEEGRMKARVNWARKTIHHYTREAKGRFSSELERIALKATRPDGSHVKSKHLEALLKPSYEMPKEVNVYESLLKKLWGKMAETDWRTVMKALYILHRFAQDSCIAQNTNLKDTFATLRGQTDPKRAVPYFDISTTCTVLSPPWVDEDVLPYSNFIKRYAEYVFNRVAWFGPGFSELLESADGYAMLLPVWPDKGGVLGLSTTITSSSYGLGGGGSYSCFAAVKELVSAGLRCHSKGVNGEIIGDAVVAISRDLHDIMEASSAQLDWLRRHPLPTSAAVNQFSDFDEEEDEDEVVEEAISAAEEYWAGLEKWKHFLMSRMERVSSRIASANELVVAAAASSSSSVRAGEGGKCIASLAVAPRVLGRWQRREEKRQRKTDRNQKNLQHFGSLIIWLLSRPPPNLTTTNAAR